jgi:formylglycine-generating enzyme required for sulfatase activity
VFLLGDEDRFVVDVELAPAPERLVRVGSFQLDVRELRVGPYRELVSAQRIESDALIHDSEGDLIEQACTYLGPDDPANDTLPLNCVSAAGADAACAALGRRLPTEAEWEFAARSRGLPLRYPWGDDGDICARAVIAVGRSVQPMLEPTGCRRLDAPDADFWGPQISGKLPDVTPLGIWELGGNLAEWTADEFAPYASQCWAGQGVLQDPRCDLPDIDGVPLPRALRGGAWSQELLQAELIRRKSSDIPRLDVGLRCAVSL